MPYYRIRFTCRGEGEIIYLADDEKEARELFESEARDCEVLRGVKEISLGTFELESIETIKEKANDG